MNWGWDAAMAHYKPVVFRFSYTCPKRKCRTTWATLNTVVANDTCPNCGAVDIAPVDAERDSSA
jgi:predicted RNA-binding Zn-ribbon protein involved in translation (DUF1610 family)